VGRRALVKAGRAGRLGNVEAKVCLGRKIWEVNEACEGCKALSKTPCLGKGWQTECCSTKGRAEPLWALPLQTSGLTTGGLRENQLKSFHHTGEGR